MSQDAIPVSKINICLQVDSIQVAKIDRDECLLTTSTAKTVGAGLTNWLSRQTRPAKFSG